MSQLELPERNVATDTQRVSTAYVPTLQRTEGQPPPVAANGGLSYMSFDRDGDAGTAKALEDALAEIAEGEGQRVIDMIDKASSGPIKTGGGSPSATTTSVCSYIRESNSLKAPEGGVALPLAYTVSERPSLFHRSVQRHLAGPGARRGRGDAAQERGGQPAAQPLFPAGAARRAAHRRVLPGPLAQQPRMHGPARRLAGAPRDPSARTSTMRRRWSACSTPRSRSCCSSSSRTPPTRWSTTTTSSTRTTRATARKTRTTRTRV